MHHGRLVTGWRPKGAFGIPSPMWVCESCATPDELCKAGVVPQTIPLSCGVCGEKFFNGPESEFTINTRKGRSTK